ncbi:hypothetical protein scyTo_0022925, partial [Scyliorhinus torazame]|nr:hypothetical protein [Scyliorhinus torazame]
SVCVLFLVQCVFYFQFGVCSISSSVCVLFPVQCVLFLVQCVFYF